MDWNRIPSEQAIERARAGLRERNYNPVIVPDREAALELLKSRIPPGAELMTGSSTTLEEIGFVEFLKGDHPWRNWKDRILAEKDPSKQLALRRASTTADYFLGSVQAITESGQVMGTDATGSRQGGYAYGAAHVIWVVGVNKIVDDLDMAFRRIYEHAVPLEDARMKRTGAPGTFVGKILICEREAIPKRVSTILVREKLGF
ncbi:MAG: lactate utilization protein [Dehalococcoidia bacterium]|nr:lactate utilization protein [Dehalococcoidia bacterium]